MSKKTRYPNIRCIVCLEPMQQDYWANWLEHEHYDDYDNRMFYGCPFVHVEMEAIYSFAWPRAIDILLQEELDNLRTQKVLSILVENQKKKEETETNDALSLLHLFEPSTDM